MVCCRAVKIDDRRIKKPYLGGWRHRATKVEYLNAESQTGPLRMPAKNTCSKKVQYIATNDAFTQSPCDHPTQMWRPDYFISSESDKYLTSKPYETYEEMMLRLDYDGKARIIQRNYRIYLLLKYVKKYAREYRRLVKDCKQYEHEKLVMYKKRHQQEILRRMEPKSRLDFDLLYDLVEKWRLDRLDCTKQRFFKAARCAQNYLIVEKTVEMLGVIDQKRQAVQARYRNRNRVRFLTVNCKPVLWHGYKGKLVEMVTMRNQKARELKAVYDSLTNYSVTGGERVEILTILKKSLEVHNCVAAFHLIRLLGQELAYLARGMRQMPLDYFRERIVYAYLYFVRSSHSCCCENSDEHFCKSVDVDKLREPVHARTRLCPSCSKLLPYSKFTVHGRMKRLSICIDIFKFISKTKGLGENLTTSRDAADIFPLESIDRSGCTWLRERNTAHVSYDPYMVLLGCVRSEERARGSSSAIAFIMQKHDIYHLVNNIWHGHSAISENRDLFALKMVRYNMKEEWSPWNCILLTDAEAEVHRRIEDLTDIYSKHLIERVTLSHQLAKNQFKHLGQFEAEFRETFQKIEDKVLYNPTIKLNDYLFT